MKKYNLNDYTKGWVVGDFNPTLYRNEHVEVGLKRFNAGETEPSHKQIVATEITIVVSGNIRMNNSYFELNDVIVVEPNEFSDFEAITDCILACIKYPSLPSDRIIK